MACSFLSISVEMFFRCIYLRRLAVRHDWSIIWWMSGLFVIVALYCGSLHWFLSWPLELIIPMASLNLDLLLVYLAGATNYVDRNARLGNEFGCCVILAMVLIAFVLDLQVENLRLRTFGKRMALGPCFELCSPSACSIWQAQPANSLVWETKMVCDFLHRNYPAGSARALGGGPTATKPRVSAVGGAPCWTFFNSISTR